MAALPVDISGDCAVSHGVPPPAVGGARRAECVSAAAARFYEVKVVSGAAAERTAESVFIRALTGSIPFGREPPELHKLGPVLNECCFYYK